MENDLNNSETYEHLYHDELKQFLKENRSVYSDNVTLLIDEIKMVEIKNTNIKVLKFTLQTYAFVYGSIMKFSNNYNYKTITTPGFFENVYGLINFKVHIHHFDVTGKIFGCAHDFCNRKIRENQVGFSCIAHNYLNFDFYFMLRGFRVSYWGEDINIGGSILSNVNFSNIDRQMKIIDAMKYF